MFKAKTELYKLALLGKSFLSKNLFLKTILASLIFSISLYADSQFNIDIKNSELVSDNTYEFDVIIKSNSDPFTLTSYQASLVFNQQAVNGGQISFSYVEGTSELSNVPAIGIGLNLTDSTPKLTFASFPGEDIINSNYIRLGHFRVQNTNPFNGSLNINLNFNGKIKTIFTGSNFEDITNLLDYSAAGVKNGESPRDFSLSQNYPNPFNPSTNIEFELKENSKVKLTVYNILGEEVAELVNGEINAGVHKVEFNGANLASGVYVYKFDAGNKFTETKKMILMK